MCVNPFHVKARKGSEGARKTVEIFNGNTLTVRSGFDLQVDVRYLTDLLSFDRESLCNV